VTVTVTMDKSSRREAARDIALASVLRFGRPPSVCGQPHRTPVQAVANL
jgi:hypothetical protein